MLYKSSGMGSAEDGATRRCSVGSKLTSEDVQGGFAEFDEDHDEENDDEAEENVTGRGERVD